MKESITVERFLERFREMGSLCPFSDEGLKSLYWHLRSWEGVIGYEVELDTADLCKRYREYDRALEAVDDIYKGYGNVLDTGRSGGSLEREALELLSMKTNVIPVGEGTKIIIRKFW